MDIIATRGRAGGYQLAHREFELPELKLLVDAVQSSKFLSVKKSRELIRKLEGLASRWEAQSLRGRWYAVGRVKSMNESIYYSIDTIHTAISQDRQIAFRYFEWTMEKTVRYRRTASSTSARLTRWCGTMRTIILWPTTTQRRRRHPPLPRGQNGESVRSGRVQAGQGDIRRLRHGAVRQTDVRDVRRCAAGRGAAVRPRGWPAWCWTASARRSHCCPTAAAFSGCMCRPSSAPSSWAGWPASARTQSCLGRLPWCGNTPPSAGRCSRSTNKR